MTQKIDLEARYLAAQKKAEEERIQTRAKLLNDLGALGVTLIEIQYEGYGDSGNVEEVTPTPNSIELTDDLKSSLGDFGWNFAYALNPGFEINDGGYGVIKWNIKTDKINVSHSTRYVETDVSEYEDL